MPRGDKSKYTEKRKSQAEHIEEGYRNRGVPADETEARAWATVNKRRAVARKAARVAARRSTKRLSKKRQGGRSGLGLNKIPPTQQRPRNPA